MTSSPYLLDPTDPDFSFAHYPFYLLSRASGRYNGEMEKALKSLGVDQAGWRMLLVLAERESLGVAEIAQLIVYKLSTATRIVKRLETAGLVTRTQSAEDGRVTQVAITDAGRALVDRSRTIARNVYRAALSDLPDEAIEHFCKMLESIDANLARRAD